MKTYWTGRFMQKTGMGKVMWATLGIITLGLLISTAVAPTGLLTLDNLLTGKVIEKVIATLADDYYGHNKSFDRVYAGPTRLNEFTRILNYSARREVYLNVIGGEEKLKATDPDMNILWYGLWPDDKKTQTPLGPWGEVCKFARSTLSTSTGLKAAYSLHKDKVVTELRKHGLAVPVRDQLKTMLPYFDGTAPKGLVEKFAKRQALLKSDDNWQGARKLEQTFRAEGISFLEQEAYDFAQRRRAEGDEPLVKAYACCIKDMIDTLTPTK